MWAGFHFSKTLPPLSLGGFQTMIAAEPGNYLLMEGADNCQPASIEPREVLVRAGSLLRRAEWRQHPAMALADRAP